MYTITVTVKDEVGALGKMSYNLPGSWTLAEVESYNRDFLLLLDAVTDGEIIKASLSSNLKINDIGLKNVASGDARERMRVQFKTEKGNYTAYYIPAMSALYADIYDDYKILDMLQDEAFDFVQLQINATAAGHPSNICDKRGELVTSIRRTKQTYFRDTLKDEPF